MPQLFVEGHNNESPDYEDADETVREGRLVVRKVGGGVALADYNVADRIDGMVPHLTSSDAIAYHEWDHDRLNDNGFQEYLPSGQKDATDQFPNKDDRVPIYNTYDATRFLPETIGSTNGPTAPSISRNAVVGVVDTSSGDAPTDAAGRIVEEGYSNGGTTFNRSNSNFVALGRADGVDYDSTFPISDFSQKVAVRLGEF
jgi:hypothetical protein